MRRIHWQLVVAFALGVGFLLGTLFGIYLVRAGLQ